MKDSHNTSQLFKCNICKKKFQTNTNLEEHYTKKHVVNEISLNQCTSCEYSTMNKYYLRQHIKRQHVWSRTTNFVCNKCYVRKPNEYLLKKHMQQHIHLKDVKNVGNGLAVRKSSDHTHKSTRRIKRWRRRRLTYSASMYLS